MGTITSGIGLVSGINTADLISKLIAIDSQPLNTLKQRIQTQSQVKAAYQALAAQFLLAKTAATNLSKPDTFNARTASSSNEDVLTATASANTPVNSYSFQVADLVTTHQVVSGGYASRSDQVGAGTLTLETGPAAVDQTTLLADLNGGQGVHRGTIRIKDRSGASTQIDLRFATTVDDILDAVNSQSDVQVHASIQGDKLVLTDQTGSTSGNLIVTDLLGGTAAADLGWAGSVAADQVAGKDLVKLADATRLSRLNDGQGVRVSGISDDLQFTLHDGSQVNVNLSGILRFDNQLAELNDGKGVRLGTIRITNRAGTAANIDLSAATTVQDVVNAINGSGISVTASLTSSKISLSDTSGGTTSNFKVEDVSGNSAADLGLTADVAATGMVGASVYNISSIGSVLRAIQYATGNGGKLTAQVSGDGDHLTFTDTTTGGATTTVADLNNSHALEDLGLNGDFSTGTLTTRRLAAGLNTVLLSSLNGGRGVDTSGLVIQRQSAGGTSNETIDLSGAATLGDIIDAINNHVDGSSVKVFHAEVSSGGTGIVVTDIADGTVTGVSGASATDLHLTATQDGVAAGGDLQRRYISEATTLASLNGGKGVAQSKFRLTGADGRTATVDVTAGDKTLGNVIDSINATNIGITARINDKGDGILLTDANAGPGKLSVVEVGSSTASDLGILGTATTNTIDGTFAHSIQIGGGDTLDSLVTKINAANANVQASVINDGSAVAPYRIVLTSKTTGVAGRINFSTGNTDLNFSTLSEAQDAKLVIGDPNSVNSVVVTSSSNTVKNVVDGLTLQLKNVSSGPVNVTVDPDVDSIVKGLNDFISAVNSGFDKIDDLTKYDPDTQTKGLLLGDSAVLQVRDRIFSALTASLQNQGLKIKSLTQIGITVGDGAHIKLDEDAFRAAFADDPDTLTKVFTLTTTDSAGKPSPVGFGGKLAQVIDQLTQSGTGLLSQEADQVQNKIDLYNDRAASMQKSLDAKQARLQRQFNAMETALASLQSQQTALASLASVAANAGGSSNLLSSLGA